MEWERLEKRWAPLRKLGAEYYEVLRTRLDDDQYRTAARELFRRARSTPSPQEFLDAAPAREDAWRKEASSKAVSHAEHVDWLRQKHPRLIEQLGPPPRPLDGMNFGFEYIRTLEWLEQYDEAERVESVLRARGWTPTTPNSMAQLKMVLTA